MKKKSIRNWEDGKENNIMYLTFVKAFETSDHVIRGGFWENILRGCRIYKGVNSLRNKKFLQNQSLHVILFHKLKALVSEYVI